ncbi:FAD/NAD(P)-binding domain-containing protein [Gonapodya prolifera JEL478]|uniref:FAD/NAD(P)-binding domain-containing protein n=1 Tax=Gonapodya prolifera (strain JEL478) TaxID=1344416 RepID=A0A139AUU4_GONPJ|nr:FAD/NAD(P)-binding domain-containing protein [Gonapodya prolifera JEL478]|eukprot:KXS20488.1 FAD/NAD(P)-binding domain-containing protein [Gonapodya prolifera JEL478]
MSTRSVLVIGAGPAGTLAALVFRSRGFSVTVCDKRGPGTSGGFYDVGGAISLYGNGLRGLRALGLLDDVMKSSGGGAERMVFQLMDGTDRIIRRQASKKKGELPPIQILRSAFLDVLLAKCKEAGVALHMDKKVTSIDQTADLVTATFSDGSSTTADFLVAADGINSSVRTLLFPSAPHARRVGVGYVGVFDLDAQPAPNVEPLRFSTPMALYMNPIEAAMVYTVHCPGDRAGSWILLQLTPPESDTDPDWEPYANLPREADRLAEVTQGWGAVESVVDAVRYAKRITPLHMFDLPDMETLHKGRVIFVGDSGHGTLPTQGQGVSQAIEDCAVLAKLMDHFPDFGAVSINSNDTPTDTPTHMDHTATVLHLYDQIRLPRAHFVAAASRAVAARWKANSRVQMRIGRLIFRSIVALKNTLRLNDAILAYDYEPDVEKAVKAVQKKSGNGGRRAGKRVHMEVREEEGVVPAAV